jgi:hypothetical protein
MQRGRVGPLHELAGRPLAIPGQEKGATDAMLLGVFGGTGCLGWTGWPNDLRADHRAMRCIAVLRFGGSTAHRMMLRVTELMDLQ